jgi:photosystem II stability/assembly factor-like uncharacterized protein
LRSYLLALCAALIVLTVGTPAVLAQGWIPQSSGVSTTLFEVLMTDVTHGTAVGAGGVIIRTTNGGVTWQNVTSGTTTNLYGVDFCCVTSGIAVGNAGLMLRTTNEGATWTALPQITTDNLRGVSFTTGSVGMVVGTNGAILRSTNGGASWVEIRGITASLYEVSFVTAEIGTVVGASGTILRTTDGGASWSVQTSGVTRLLLGASFTDANHGTVVGASGTILRTTNGGATWTPQSSGVTTDLTSVTMIDQSLGYIVGNQGVVLRTTNGGTTWAAQPSGITTDLNEVSFTDAFTGTTVGAGGVILRTVSGGEPGSALALGSPNGGESYAVGSTLNITWNSTGFTSAKIELSRDGGTSWETLNASAPAGDHAYAWTVQAPASSQCKVRLSDSANPALTDITDGLFAITPASVNGNYAIDNGWNLVSVPLTVADYQKSSLYPTATSVAYSYDSADGYQVRSVLENRKGYWLKFGGSQNVSMTGYPRDTDTIVVQTGWNLMGSITTAVPIGSLVTTPPGIITGVIYGFNVSGYYTATSIEPGKAYWVKVTQPGQIIVTSATPPSLRNR